MDPEVAPPALASLTLSLDAPAPPRGAPTARGSEDYDIAGEHARGGLGRVLRARDRRLDRVVALKELLRATPEAAARFTREARLTARLQHPGIVPIYEAGRFAGGKPFYSMKLVEGHSLKDVLAERPTLAARLELLPNMLAVADAIAYAHAEGVIHRDLKPSNVMVGPFGETVVIDWGLAKDLRDGRAEPEPGPYRARFDGHTLAGTVLGTPTFMPPEQARAEPVDERADVYALGAMLYHLIVGAAPYDACDSEDALRQLIAGPPAPLREREPRVPAELAAIVEKAMARAAQERYPSARELAADLRRLTAGQLVSVHAYSLFELARRWARRHAVLLAAAAAFVLAAIAVGGVSVRRIVHERNLADARKNELILVEARSSVTRDPTATLAWLRSYPLEAPHWNEVEALAAEARGRGVARHILGGFEERVDYVEFSPDGRRLLTAANDGEVRLWDAARGALVAERREPFRTVAVRMAPDGRTLALAGWGGQVELWQPATGEVRRLIDPAVVRDVAFSPDGRALAAAGTDGVVRVWSLPDGRLRELRGHVGTVHAVAYSPTGVLISSGADGTVRRWPEGRVLARLPHPIRKLALSPSGRELAAAADDGTLIVAPLDGSAPARRLVAHHGYVDMAFADDGRSLVSAGWDKQVRLWDLQAGTSRLLYSHESEVHGLALSPAGLLATSGVDGTIRLTNLRSGRVRLLRGHRASVPALAFSPDGAWLASAGEDKTARLWDVREDGGRLLTGHTAAVNDVIYFPDGLHLASAASDDTIRIWDLAGGPPRVLLGHRDRVLRLALDASGRTLASSGWDLALGIWDPARGTGRLVHAHDKAAWQLALTPDGKTLVSGGGDGVLRVASVATGSARAFLGHRGEINAIALSPDGRSVVSGGEDHTVRVWDLASGRSRVLYGHTDQVNRVAFSPDGGRVASASWDSTARIWDLATGRAQVLRGHRGRLKALAFSPDGRTLATGSLDDTIRLWDLRSGTSRLLAGHEDLVSDLAFSPDGRWLASGSNDGTVRIWDVARGALRAVYVHRSYVSRVAFAPDGKHVASASWDDTVGVWPLGTEPPSDPAQLRRWMALATSAQVIDGDRVATP